MESVIIEEMRAFMRLDLNPRQKQYFADTIAVAKRVDIVRAADVYIKRVYFIVPDLDLMGNDDCPECGGEMEVTDGEYKQTGGDGYITPPEYTAIWEQKTCRNCGHIESDEPSY